MAGWASSKPMSGYEKRTQLEDEVDIFKPTPNEYVQVRFIGPIRSYAEIWFESKGKEGGKKRKATEGEGGGKEEREEEKEKRERGKEGKGRGKEERES